MKRSRDSIALFSSKCVEWETPDDLFFRLNKVYKFTIDVCASDDNKKLPVFFSAEENGLAQQWNGSVWMNPPYGSGIESWVRKAYQASRSAGTIVVALLPARTDTAWWEWVLKARKIFFIRGRLRFGEEKRQLKSRNISFVRCRVDK